jgi:hypothetical protein
MDIDFFIYLNENTHRIRENFNKQFKVMRE